MKPIEQRAKLMTTGAYTREDGVSAFESYMAIHPVWRGNCGPLLLVDVSPISYIVAFRDGLRAGRGLLAASVLLIAFAVLNVLGLWPHLPAPMQDALCVLATGGGFAKRKLYSDAEESVITVKRPIILNGISAAVTAQDLVDRAITIETPVITERQEVTGLWREYEESRAHLLGALLDIAAKALAVLPDMQLPANERPRLVEFALLGMAVAKAVGRAPEEFMQEFKACRQERLARTFDASPVAGAVVE